MLRRRGQTAFSLREVLLDAQRMLSEICALQGMNDLIGLRERIREIAAYYVHGIAPHGTQHMTDVSSAIDAG